MCLIYSGSIQRFEFDQVNIEYYDSMISIEPIFEIKL